MNKEHRFVKFRKRIERTREKPAHYSDYIYDGVFWMWGSNFEEFENNAGNYTTALIELEDGTIEEVNPTNIKFVEPTPFE